VSALGRLVLLAGLVLPVVAADLRWDRLPQVGYEREDFSLAFRPGDGAAGWSLTADDGVAITLRPEADGQVLAATVSPAGRTRLVLAKDQQRVVLNLVRPGQAQGLELDGDRHLTAQGGLAILLLERLEADIDRRWSILRFVEKPLDQPCTVRLDAPAVPWGESALTAQVCASQRLAVGGVGLLVPLDGSDRWAGWKHRAYRQMAAWLVADVLARGARRVVLVAPAAPPAERDAIAPLAAQAVDVAHSYHCALVDPTPLAKDAYWELAPGVLGTSLNADGRRVLAELIRPWWAGHD
jgi:hypothetical protein